MQIVVLHGWADALALELGAQVCERLTERLEGRGLVGRKREPDGKQLVVARRKQLEP